MLINIYFKVLYSFQFLKYFNIYIEFFASFFDEKIDSLTLQAPYFVERMGYIFLFNINSLINILMSKTNTIYIFFKIKLLQF